MARTTRGALACLTLMACAVLVPLGRPASAQWVGSRGFSFLQIQGNYTGSPSSCQLFCPDPYSLDGTIDATVGCILFWCIGSVRVVTQDPLEAGKTVTSHAIGFGYPQVCPESEGTHAGIGLFGVASRSDVPGIASSLTNLGIWLDGPKAGEFRATVTAGPEWWEISGKIDLARVNMRPGPFELPLYCL